MLLLCSRQGQQKEAVERRTHLYSHACPWLPPACLASVVFKRCSFWEGLGILHTQRFNNAHRYHRPLFCFAFLHLICFMLDVRENEMYIADTVETFLVYAPLSSLSLRVSLWNCVCAPVYTYTHMYRFYPLLKSVAVKTEDYDTYKQVSWVGNLVSCYCINFVFNYYFHNTLSSLTPQIPRCTCL